MKPFITGLMPLLIIPVYLFAHIPTNKDLFENKKILITGGTGFIGKALVQEILKYNPCRIAVFSRDEVKHDTFLRKFNDPRLHSILGDIRNYESLLEATRGMDIVIHAAALKRIDMIEYHINESIYTNVVGTVNVVKACTENNVSKALFVSTDKACSPVNAYGGCKFVSEKIFNNFTAPESVTTFLTVRYGNVIQSTGSVIPFFCEKIRNGQPVPITDPEMTRFLITKEQAVELIFKALHYGIGGEIFVPQLPAFRIIDLVGALQTMLGRDTGMYTIGLRPGEKIHEMMINSPEAERTYSFDNMYVITSTVTKSDKEPLYKTRGRRLESAQTFEYSSGDNVLTQQDMVALLQKHNIELN